MTIKEAILKSLEELEDMVNSGQIYDFIIKNNYYDFKQAKTPKSTISAQLGEFIRNNDTRIKRIKGKSGIFYYYLTKFEQNIDIDNFNSSKIESIKKESKTKKTYHERDLHKLLSSYLKNKNIYSKTILHEESKNSKDDHQKWIHPCLLYTSPSPRD